MSKDVSWRIFMSLLLGMVTDALFTFLATAFSGSFLRDFVAGAASFPGNFVARGLFPDGTSKDTAGSWWTVAIGSQVLFYAVIWLAVLTWRKRRGQSAVY